MEEVKKQARLSKEHEHPRQHEQQPFIGGISEEEFRSLLREESTSLLSGERHLGPFLHWLHGYICSPALYRMSIPTLRHLHGWLILQLSCTFTARENYEMVATIRLLIACLRQIYLNRCVANFLDPSELQETILAHTRLTTRLASESIGEYEHECIIVPCFRSLYILFDTYMKLPELTTFDLVFPIEEFKDFLLALLDLFRRRKSDGSISVSFPAHQLLSRIRANGCNKHDNNLSIYFWAQIARQAVEDLEYENVESERRVAFTELQQRYQSHTEWLFHVECRTSLLLPGCHYDLVESELRAFESGVLSEDMSLSSRWSLCLAKVSRKHPFDKDLLHFLVRILLVSSSQEANLILITGLYRMNRGKSTKDIAECIVKDFGSTTKQVISILVDMILTVPTATHTIQHMPHWRRGTGSMLRDVLIASRSNFPATVSDNDIVSICMACLDSDHTEAIRCAVETLHHQFTYMENFSGWNMDTLIKGLAAPLGCTSVDLSTKERVLNLYSILSNRNRSSLSHIARQPQALESLVKAASIGPLRSSAIALLVSMANDPTNHRIMAKQTGLLSSLVRHVRELESVDEESYSANLAAFGTIQDREAIKGNILQIAAAL